MSMKALPSHTVRLLGSSQVITSVVSVVKELLENSLDAGATSVDIRLEDYGFGKIEVRDNGDGIALADTEFMGQPHYTSKISSHADLDNLDSYGFRGEALGSLCAVADVSITTKTQADEVSRVYKLDTQGKIVDVKPSHLGQGTTVAACNLFKALPVRKQFYSSAKRRKEELKRVEDLVMNFSVIWPNTRLTLRHNKDLIWQKNIVESPKNVLMQILGANVMSSMFCIEKNFSNNEVKVEAILPKADADPQLVTRSTPDRTFVAVNRRPVIMKTLEKALKQVYSDASGGDSSRYPVGYISTVVMPSSLDVNIDPNKTRVMLHNQEIIEEIKLWLKNCYDSQKEQPEQPTRIHNPEQDTEARVPSVSPGNFDLDFNILSQMPPAPKGTMPSVTNEEEKVNLSVASPAVFEDRPNKCLTDPNKKTSPEKPPRMEDVNGNVTSGDPGKGKVSSSAESNTQGTNALDKQKTERTGLGNIEFDFENIKASFEKEIHRAVSSAENGKSEEKSHGTPAESIFLISTNFPAVHTEDSNKKGTTIESYEVSDSLLGEVKTECIEKSYQGRPTGESKITEVPLVQDHSNQKDLPDTNQKSSDDWTKGTALKDASGKIIEPVRLLPPTTSDTPGNKRKLPSDFQVKETPTKRLEVGQPTLLEVVNSPQLLSKKQSSPFSLYAKQIRPAVVEEHPEATYDDISMIIEERWANLAQDRKKIYENMAEQSSNSCLDATNTPRPKDSGKPDVKSCRASKKIRPDKKRPDLKGLLLSQSQASPKPKAPGIKVQQPKVKTVTLRLNMECLKQKYSSSLMDSQSLQTPALQPLGQLHPHNAWVCLHNNRLVLLVLSRAKECLLYKQLMQEFVCPLTELKKPLPLNEEVLGGLKNLQTLLGMQANHISKNCSVFTDLRLVHNGFKIMQTNGDEPALEVVAMSECMPSYGLSDLQEILQTVGTAPVSCPEECRPVKIIHYLQGEAVRLCRQSSTFTKEEVFKLCRQIHTQLPQKQKHCFHDKPFLIDLFDMEDIPHSQDSQLS